MNKKKSNKKVKRAKYGTGTAVKNYIENPYEELQQNQINLAEAQYKANTNPLTIGLQTAGNLAMQYGMSQGGFQGMGGIDEGQANTLNSLLPVAGNMQFADGGTVGGPGDPPEKVLKLKKALIARGIPLSRQEFEDDDYFSKLPKERIDKLFNDLKVATGGVSPEEGQQKIAALQAKNPESQVTTIKKNKFINPSVEVPPAEDEFTYDLERTQRPQLQRSMVELFAMGGKVPVEVEGGEVAEDPAGNLLAFNGPSHSNGGIDIDLPGGTEIFSDRIKVEGKTMAERKMAREKKEESLMARLKKSVGDNILKSTFKKVQADNQAQEAKDTHIQNILKTMKDLKSDKYANGGTVPSFDEWMRNQGVDPNGPLKDKFLPQYNQYAQNATGYTPVQSGVGAPQLDTPQFEVPALGTKGSITETPSAQGRNLLDYIPKSNTTAGDVTSYAGKAFSSVAPLLNTLQNRAQDTPNINAFENYGQEGLQTLDKTKGYVEQVRDRKLQDLELARNAGIKRGRNTARGVNTMRALDLATDQAANTSKSQVYDSFAQQMMSILSQEAGMENQQDQMVMQGEQQRDIADRQDTDNFYTQRGQDLASLGEGVQNIGKDMNAARKNKMIENLINQLSPYNLKFDKDGNIIPK